MELLYLGTAAAEGAPALFCTCQHCQYARRVGGKEIRTRSGALLDGKIKIDFGPDSFKQMIDNHLDYTHLRTCLITHSHSDHFCAKDLSFRRQGYAQLPADEPALVLYGNEKVTREMDKMDTPSILTVSVRPYVPFIVEGYTVTPLEGVHCVDMNVTTYPVVHHGRKMYRTEEVFSYLIEKDGKSLYYAHDTGGISERNLEYLQDKHLSLISLDCDDCSWQTSWPGHMGIRDDLEAREELLKVGAADEHTIFVANHFSHNGLIPYEEIQKRMPGFIVSYDGMKVDF